MTEQNKAQKIKFALNYWLLFGLVVPITGMEVFLVRFFFIPVLYSIDKLSNIELWSAAIVAIVTLGSVVFAWVLGYIESSIEFSDENIKKKGVFKSTTIQWSEVDTVFMIGPRIFIKSNTKKIQVNVFYYREPNQIVDFIKNHYKVIE